MQEEKAKVIQTLLFVAGLNTLLQTWFGTRLPAVIGGSYTFVAPTISIILSGRWDDPDPIMVSAFCPTFSLNFEFLLDSFSQKRANISRLTSIFCFTFIILIHVLTANMCRGSKK